MEVFPGISIGDKITFRLFGQSIIGTEYTNVKVDGVLDWHTAGLLGDVAAKHKLLYPTITTPNTPESFDQIQYLKVTLPNGTSDVVGITWIDSSSIVKVTKGTAKVTIENIDGAGLEAVRKALLSVGVTEFSIVHS